MGNSLSNVVNIATLGLIPASKSIMGILDGSSAAKAQAGAQSQVLAQTQALQNQQDQAMNAANAKSPNTAGILQNIQAQAGQGVSGTMLTGPTGVNPTALTLGKNTLLGS
ncbi:MAG: hypothetical protein KGI50_06375 [Patescibacteria group bacterium]|nr:hypothetical protein [Patescibacteria group bacterium]